MWKKYRFRLFGAFLIIVLLCSVAMLINGVFINRWNQLGQIEEELGLLRTSFIEANASLSALLYKESSDTTFHATHQSKNYNALSDNIAKANQLLSLIEENHISDELGFDEFILPCRIESKNLESETSELLTLLLARGFWNYGTEGDIRLYAHALESDEHIKLEDLLFMRRDEKDYRLRFDDRYIEKLNIKAESLISSDIPEETRLHLVSYQHAFERMVELDSEIGIGRKGGLSSVIEDRFRTIFLTIDEMQMIYAAQQELLYSKLLVVWILGMGGILFFAVMISTYLSSVLADDITSISDRVKEFVDSGFKGSTDLEQVRSSTAEIGDLEMNIQKMSRELVTLVADLKEQRTKAENAASTKSRFLANMSHEIRTPLNGVIGTTQLMNDTNLNERQKKYLDVIQFSGNHLLGIINDILDYSKIDAGKMTFEKHSFNLKEVLEKVTSMLQIKAQEKNLALELVMSEDLPNHVLSDSIRLKQVLINLVNNAVKFTDTGKVEVQANNVGENHDETLVRFEVNDTGIGIPKEKQATLFNAFEQADDSTTRKYGGTGLGLTIAHEIVNRFGGKLEVDSDIGQGSSFTFTLPLKTTKEKGQTQIQKGLNVLLAEDNLINQEVIKTLLKRYGCEVDVAENGQVAVEKYTQNQYDLVFMDLQMPIMSGYEAWETIQILVAEYGRPKVPVVAVTANADTEEKNRVLNSGMDFLKKPLVLEALEEFLKTRFPEKTATRV